MDEQTVYTEVLKAGLKFVADNFTNTISNINKKRLEEKKNKKEKEEKEDKRNDKRDPIELTEAEKIKGRVNLNIEKASDNIQKHIEDIERWAYVIKFSDLEKKRTLGSVYIQLDTYLLPAKRHFSIIERSRTIALEKAVLSGKEHCIILGQPGAGKTTSLKKICDIIIKERKKSNYAFPILLRLRDLGDLHTTKPIFEHIANIIPFEFDFTESREVRFTNGANDAREEAIFSFLNFIKPILILDGFDELKDSATKATVLSELKKIANKLTNCKLVLSCRTGEFDYELEHSNTYEIAPLNNEQIESFVKKWLNDAAKANDFLTKVKNSPFADTSIKPLSLAHLCAIYQRIGNIPDQPKTIYRKVVNLLIEEWDEQRSIIRMSEFGSFQADQKFEFLAHLAFVLTTTYQTSTFSVDQFKAAYEKICEYHSLPRGSADNVVRELEAHTGLFIESGYDKYEFVHKSIQEFLTAEYLVKLPSLNSVTKYFEILGSELAIAVSISSNPSLYYIELILNYFLRQSLPGSFYSSFSSRIVSENPAFNQNELVSVATLVLISSWAGPNNRYFDGASDSTLIKDRYSSFFDLAKSLGLKKQKGKIFDYYEYSCGIQNNTLVELIRIKEPENHKRIPSKIHIPMEFYMEFVDNK